MPAGCGDEEYVGVVERIVVPAALGFGPDLIVVSCGFDAHRDDPLASMQVTYDGYRRMASILRSLADMLCEGRIVHVLEGGYALSGVREGARAVLESLVDESTPLVRDDRDGRTDLPAGTMLRSLVDGVYAVHGRRIPNLGSR
jgi:acetoin utilization deacetylase AcuC-like enzyme